MTMSVGPGRRKPRSCYHHWDTILTIPADLDTTISVLEDANASASLLLRELQDPSMIDKFAETPGTTEQIETKILKILKTKDWAGKCALQDLLDNAQFDYGRKWRYDGVFTKLRRICPERRQELDADRDKHRLIIVFDLGMGGCLQASASRGASTFANSVSESEYSP